MEIQRMSPLGNKVDSLISQSSPFPGSSTQQEAGSEQEVRIQPITQKDLRKTVDALNQMFESAKTHLQFTLHEKSGEYYVKIIDEQKNEVVREIPSKKMLDIIFNIQKSLGLIVDKKV